MSSPSDNKTLEKSSVSFAKTLAAVRTTLERTVVNPIINFYSEEKNVTLTEEEKTKLYEKLEDSAPMFSHKIKTVASQTVKSKTTKKNTKTGSKNIPSNELCVYKYVRGKKKENGESCKNRAKTHGFCGTHVKTAAAKKIIEAMKNGDGRDSVKAPGYVKPGVNDPTNIKKTVDETEDNGIGIVDGDVKFIKLEPTEFYISLGKDISLGHVYLGENVEEEDEDGNEIESVSLDLKYTYENGTWRVPTKEEIKNDEDEGSTYVKADKEPKAQLKEINKVVDLSKTDITNYISLPADLIKFSKIVGINYTPPVKKVVPKKITKALECPDCDYKVGTKGAMTRHFNSKKHGPKKVAKKVTSADLKCPDCSYTSKNKEPMERHFNREKHGSKKEVVEEVEEKEVVEEVEEKEEKEVVEEEEKEVEEEKEEETEAEEVEEETE